MGKKGGKSFLRKCPLRLEHSMAALDKAWTAGVDGRLSWRARWDQT